MSGLRRYRRAAVIGLAFGAVLLAALFARADLDKFVQALARIAPAWLLASALIYPMGVWLRATRWRLLARAPDAAATAFWDATVIGYVGNVFYVARIGEVLRMGAIAVLAHLRAGRAVASAVADRLADVVILALAAVATLAITVVDSPAGRIVVIVLPFVALAAALFAAFVLYGARLRFRVGRWARALPRPWAARVPGWYRQAVVTAQLLRRPRLLGATLGLSVAATLLDYVALWCVLRAMEWTLGAEAALVVGTFAAFGGLLPSGPVQAGPLQLACVLSLALFGIGESDALAFSVALTLVTVIQVGAQGLVVLARHGRGLIRG